MASLDFELEIQGKGGRDYAVRVIRSPAGEAPPAPMVFPYDELALKVRQQALEIALLKSGATRRAIGTEEEQTVRQFGGDLFDALIAGEVRSRFDVSQMEAHREEKVLRVKLRFLDAPDLAELPWEYLYDSRKSEYLVLSTNTPLVRYIELPEVIEPLTISPPLRILGLVASPSDLPAIDVGRERARVEEATKELQARGEIEIEWLPTGTWRELQRALRGTAKWHIFHFVGHGGFDPNSDEGLIALPDEEGKTFRLHATELARLLGDHRPLRLAVLNACEGARSSTEDLFSSTAATVVRRGTPAVVAMQYEITDRAAIEFGRSFYEAIADGLSVDGSVAEARKAMSVAIPNTLEWGTPVLFTRSPDGVLFRVHRDKARPRAATPAAPTAVLPAEPATPSGERGAPAPTAAATPIAETGAAAAPGGAASAATAPVPTAPTSPPAATTPFPAIPAAASPAAASPAPATQTLQTPVAPSSAWGASQAEHRAMPAEAASIPGPSSAGKPAEGSVWGAATPAQPRSRSRVPLIAVGAVVVGAVLVAGALLSRTPNEPFVPGQTQNAGRATTPVNVGSGLRVAPPSDWIVAGSPVGMDGVRFQIGGVIVDVGVTSFTDSKELLLANYLQSVLVPVPGEDGRPTTFGVETAANGRQSARADYSGSYPAFGTAIEGELAVQVDASSGLGIVVNAFAIQGHLDDVDAALRAVVDTIEVGS